MTYQVVYNLCMVVSTIVEIYLAFDFYKVFHSVRIVFNKTSRQILLASVIIFVNLFINIHHFTTFLKKE